MREERNHNNFDSYIRQELEQLTPDLKAGAWDKLSQRLDIAEQMDAFDEQTSSSLKDMHIPYKSSSWGVLAQRLTLERDRIQAVMHYKAMEISLLVLLLITFWQHSPIINNDIQKTSPTYPIANIDLGKPENNLKNPVSLNINQAATLKEEQLKPIIEGTEQTLLPNHQPSGIHQELEEGGNLFSHYTEDEKIAESRPLNPLPSVNALGIKIIHDAHAQLVEYRAAKTSSLSTPTDDFRQDGALTTLDGKEIALLDYGEAEDLLKHIRPSDKKTAFRVGFFGSPDFNHIITPLQRLDNGTDAAFDTYSFSYSGGITLGMGRGKWEMELGAIYEARNYKAIPTVYISGNIAEGYTALSLKDIELNTINLPLRFKYNFITNDKWRVYAMAGASLNIVLSANYYTVEPEIPSTREAGSTNGTSRVTKPYSLRNENLTKGLFEGGSFWENTTFYANAGMGVERYMSYKWSMFIQPTFQLALPLFNKGLGPYNDRINSLGINIGMKVRL